MRHYPGQGWGIPDVCICHSLEPPPGAGAPVRGRESELHLPLYHVVHRIPRPWRVGGHDSIPLPAREGEGGGSQGEFSDLSQLARPLGILGHFGGERASLSGERGPGTGVVSWPAAGMHRPTTDRRLVSRNTAPSMALLGFTFFRAK